MVDAFEIGAFLKDQNLFSNEFGGSNHSVQIDGIAAFENATSGAMSWISPKRHAKSPQQWQSFLGGILIAPDTIKEGISGSFRVITSKNPKLAFIKAANRFFPSLTAIELPSVSDGPISPKAVIGKNVFIAAGTIIGANVVIENDVWIGANSVLVNCNVAAHSRIGCNCTIGFPGFGYEKDDQGSYSRFPHIGRVLIGRNVEIGSNSCIDRGALDDTIIEDGCKIDNQVHVAHNVHIGKNSIVIANSLIGGSARIGENAWVAPSVSVLNQVSIGANALIGMGAVVIRDVEAGQTIVGNPGKELKRRT